MNERAIRRNTEQRSKKKAVFLWKHIWRKHDEPSNKWLGMMASTHNKPCSCEMCRNLRQDEGPTLQERRFQQSEKEFANEEQA